MLDYYLAGAGYAYFAGVQLAVSAEGFDADVVAVFNLGLLGVADSAVVAFEVVGHGREFLDTEEVDAEFSLSTVGVKELYLFVGEAEKEHVVNLETLEERPTGHGHTAEELLLVFEAEEVHAVPDGSGVGGDDRESEALTCNSMSHGDDEFLKVAVRVDV